MIILPVTLNRLRHEFLPVKRLRIREPVPEYVVWHRLYDDRPCIRTVGWYAHETGACVVWRESAARTILAGVNTRRTHDVKNSRRFSCRVKMFVAKEGDRNIFEKSVGVIAAGQVAFDDRRQEIRPT